MLSCLEFGEVNMETTGEMLIEFVDSEGVAHWVEVTAGVAAVLAEAEPRMKEFLLRKPEGIEQVAEKSYGEYWSGPRLAFRWLLGEGWPWSGGLALWEHIPDPSSGEMRTRCRFCKGNTLPHYAYCLGCDRCGRELRIPPPVERALARHKAEARKGLKGGCEGKK